MKVFKFIFITTIFLSCIGRNKYKAEDFKQQQIDYEKRKAEIIKSKSQFYKDNKQALMELVKTVNFLLDSNNQFTDAPSDTGFFLNDVVCDPINYVHSYNSGSAGNKTKVKVIFLKKNGEKDIKDIFTDPLQEIRSCYENNNDISCIQMKQEKLQKLVDLKYAFVIEEMLKIDPVVRGKDFESGIYLGKIVCYDLKEKKTILAFAVSATNSESVQVFGDNESSIKTQVQSDFRSNIRTGVLVACKKHFNF